MQTNMQPIPMEGTVTESRNGAAMAYPVVQTQQQMQYPQQQMQYPVQQQQFGQVQVVQSVVAVPQAPIPRVSRNWYGYFAIAMGIYHGVWTIIFMFLSADITFFLCGFIPSLATVIWIILDATVACCNGKICGCDCCGTGKWVMVIPMGIATFLRCILYLVLFSILANILDDVEGGEEHIDNVFWMILTYAAFDAGPMILLTIDWTYYYSGSKNGLFGRHTNPMRCVLGQQAVLFIGSWAFIAAISAYSDNVAEFAWPWILHGVISSAALVFCASIHFTGIVTGNKLSNQGHVALSKLLAVAMGVGVFAIVIFVVLSISDGPVWIPGLILYLYYYTALSLPSVAAMASFKIQEEAPDQIMMEAAVAR